MKHNREIGGDGCNKKNSNERGPHSRRPAEQNSEDSAPSFGSATRLANWARRCINEVDGGGGERIVLMTTRETKEKARGEKDASEVERRKEENNYGGGNDDERLRTWEVLADETRGFRRCTGVVGD